MEKQKKFDITVLLILSMLSLLFFIPFIYSMVNGDTFNNATTSLHETYNSGLGIPVSYISTHPIILIPIIPLMLSMIFILVYLIRDRPNKNPGGIKNE